MNRSARLEAKMKSNLEAMAYGLDERGASHYYPGDTGWHNQTH